MLFKDRDFVLTAHFSVRLHYWPGSGSDSRKKWSGRIEVSGRWVDVRELHTGLVQQVSAALSVATAPSDVIRHMDESHTGSLRPPSCINCEFPCCVSSCESNSLPEMFLNFEASV